MRLFSRSSILHCGAALLPCLVVGISTPVGQMARPRSANLASDSVAIRPLSTQDDLVAFLQDVPAIQAPIRTVIRDESSWATFWAHATSAGQHVPEVMTTPVVDFSREMIIAVSDGLRPAGTYVSVARIETVGRTLVVHILLRTHIPPACMTAGGYAPLALVRIARSDLPVTFVETEESRNCAAGSR